MRERQAIRVESWVFREFDRTQEREVFFQGEVGRLVVLVFFFFDLLLADARRGTSGWCIISPHLSN